MQHLLHEIISYNAFDFLTIGTLIVLEGLLSVDNALVLASIVKKLPRALQRKALTYGVAGAVIFRVIAVFLATVLIKITFVKFIGGAYLIFLSFKHMFPAASSNEENKEQQNLKASNSFFATIVLVELTDIVFSIDSITTAVAMTSKVTVIILGGIAGILAMRFVAMAFIKLLEKYPSLDDIAYQLIFFIGLKLVLGCFHFEIDEGTFWLIAGFIVLVGVSVLYRNTRAQKETTTSLITAQSEDFIQDIMRNRISLPELFQSDRQFSADFIRYMLKHGYIEYTRKATIPRLKKVNDEMYSDREAEMEQGAP